MRAFRPGGHFYAGGSTVIILHGIHQIQVKRGASGDDRTTDNKTKQNENVLIKTAHKMTNSPGGGRVYGAGQRCMKSPSSPVVLCCPGDMTSQ